MHIYSRSQASRSCRGAYQSSDQKGLFLRNKHFVDRARIVSSSSPRLNRPTLPFSFPRLDGSILREWKSEDEDEDDDNDGVFESNATNFSNASLNAVATHVEYGVDNRRYFHVEADGYK